MASQTQICNHALTLLGKDPISSITEQSVVARALTSLWERTVDSLLRAHPWNFAIRRVHLGRLSDDPAFGYEYQYQIPPSCLRVLGVDDDTIDYQIEGSVLLTDADTISIRYIANVGVSEFDSAFCELLSIKLAAQLCYPLTQNATLSGLLNQMYDRTLQQVRSIDAQEGYDRRIMNENAWLEVRI